MLLWVTFRFQNLWLPIYNRKKFKKKKKRNRAFDTLNIYLNRSFGCVFCHDLTPVLLFPIHIHLEKEMAIHSSILAWRIPWTEEPGGLQSTGLQRVGHDWASFTLEIFALVSFLRKAIVTLQHSIPWRVSRVRYVWSKGLIIPAELSKGFPK